MARYAPLVVECPHRFSDWFSADPPGMCPQEPPLASSEAAQRFEHGMMIWIAELDRTYVIYDRFVGPGEDVSTSVGFTSTQIVDGPLDLTPGASPDNRVGVTPPHRRFEPVGEFGLVWRGEVVLTEDVRRRLGRAVEREYAFDTVSQCARNCGSCWDCCPDGPEGRTLHVQWRMHVGQFWELVG